MCGPAWLLLTGEVGTETALSSVEQNNGTGGGAAQITCEVFSKPEMINLCQIGREEKSQSGGFREAPITKRKE